MQTRKIDLELEWKRLCSDLCVGEVHVVAGFQEIQKRYSEPHRVYHTLEHVRDCLCLFQEVREQCEYPLVVEFAIWFHDLVYVFSRKDNERKSAKHLVEFAKASGVDQNVITAAEFCVLATQHYGTSLLHDAQIVVDIDLSILGRSPEDYLHYAKNIRQEYKHVPQLIYTLRRRDVLKRFLDRPYIYSTSHFREYFEKQARANIANELRSLRLI